MPESIASVATDVPTTSLLRPLAEDLRARREQIMLGGGELKVAAQHAQDKLTARERLALLIDEGTFVELGIHGRPHFSQRAMDGREAPADGVITGYGKVNGRLTAVAAYDFTVMAGSMGMTGELKVTRLRELALSKRIPLVWLLDSAGARVQEAVGSLFAGSGHLFREEVVMSGVIPQVAALMGPCAAGTAYIPALADFVPMVRGRGSMALAGPHLVRAAVGEDVTQEELGGSRVHCRKSGVGDLEVADDPDCIAQIKRYLSFFPQNCEEAPPVVPRGPGSDPVDRGDDELLDVLPQSNRKPYDMYEVIRRIVDDGEHFDLKPQFAKTIITCLARFGGRPAGIVANQPKQLGGILDNDSADKAARFINLCNAYGIPLVYLMDVPGFMVGTKVEQAGIIRHGAKMLYA
ncbi:MAG: carboxyl transferase domain-containing protein, partial [Solirubrobacteraceae bacterium]